MTVKAVIKKTSAGILISSLALGLCVTPAAAKKAKSPDLPGKTLVISPYDKVTWEFTGIKKIKIKKVKVTTDNKKLISVKPWNKSGITITSQGLTGKAGITVKIISKKKTYTLKKKVEINTNLEKLAGLLTENEPNGWDQPEIVADTPAITGIAIEKTVQTKKKNYIAAQSYFDKQTGTSIVTWYNTPDTNMEKGSVSTSYVSKGKATPAENGQSTYSDCYAYEYTELENNQYTGMKKYLLGPNVAGEAGNAAYQTTKDFMIIFNSGDGAGICPYLDHTFVPDYAGNVKIKEQDDRDIYTYNVAKYETIKITAYKSTAGLLANKIMTIEVTASDGSRKDTYYFNYNTSPTGKNDDPNANIMEDRLMLGEIEAVKNIINGTDKKVTVNYALDASKPEEEKTKGTYEFTTGKDVQIDMWFSSFPTGEFYLIQDDGTLVPMISISPYEIEKYLNPKTVPETPVEVVWKDTTVG